MPEPLAPLALPRVAQTLDFTCGAACFESMVRFFLGSSPGELFFAHALGTVELGYTPPERIVELARSYGLQAQLVEQATRSDLCAAFARGAVVFVTWWDEDAGHYSLVKHVDGTHVVLMDPWTARVGQDNRRSWAEFQPHWERRGARMIACARV